jgi:DNA-binding NtrC family response regulator
LRGRSGADERSFPLVEGDNLVGSAARNAIVLPERGVSRHHATIRVEAGIAAVLDLDSKNGVRINGRAVRHGALSPGDEVTFGTVTLRLEEIDAGDAELAVSFGAARSELPPGSDPGATSLLADGEAPAMAWVRLLADVAQRLCASPADREGALAALVRRLEIDGAALVEWRPPADMVVELAAGRVGELPREVELPPPGTPRLRLLAMPDGVACTLWSERLGDAGTLGLILWGELRGRSECLPLLAALGNMLRRSGPEPLATFDRGGPEPSAALAFPSDYVPGESPAMRALYRQMEALASADLPVLVQGETGSGKEPIARTLHASSPRRHGPFVAVNCAAIPAELLEAEMFGIGKNVATGVAPRPGKMVEASGGTLFLDEIGDMPLPLQAKLLRALQEKVVQPVGAPAVAVDVRVVAATNMDLVPGTADGSFRRDLYYRIAGFVLEVPPLRRRADDVPLLVGHFLRKASRDSDKALRGITVKALRHLAAYGWPGNVRELEHEMRRLVYLCPRGGVIDSLMLPDRILAPPPESGDGGSEREASSLDLLSHSRELERRLIRLALARARGNQSRAAQLLGISRNGLANRLKRLGLDPAEPERSDPR